MGTDQTTYEESGELDNFNRAAAREMRRRLEDGARKFGALSWRREVYTDADNVARLRRAVDHLVGVLVRWRNPETATVADARELWKRAADVSNQAFMLADQLRHDGNEPMPFDLTDSYNVGFREGVARAARERPSALDALLGVIATAPEWIGWDTIFCYWCSQTDTDGHAADCAWVAAKDGNAERILARLTEPDAGEGTERATAYGNAATPNFDCCAGAITHAPDCPTGINAHPTPDTTEATLRAALLRIFDLAENRPDIRETARAALQQPAVQPEGGPE